MCADNLPSRRGIAMVMCMQEANRASRYAPRDTDLRRADARVFLEFL